MSKLDLAARRNAQDQWNTHPCESQYGDPNGDRTAYFRAVEEARYRIQPWMHGRLDFPRFSGKSVLEIGPGQGTDLAQFAKAGARCFGIDITERHMELARENLGLRGYPVEIKRSDATQIDYPAHSFDVVYSFGVLHHIPEIEQCLAEAHRVLRPGGKLIFAVYHRWSVAYLFSVLLYTGLRRGQLWKVGYKGVLAQIETGADGAQLKPYVRLYSKGEVRRLVRRAGFAGDRIVVRQVNAGDFGFNALAKRVPDALLRALDPHFGWYVICEATAV
jgi:2-polyprenyl-3-methyl-5-hydroxy-6-metoxy-1,4-benzoquinol methylase